MDVGLYLYFGGGKAGTLSSPMLESTLLLRNIPSLGCYFIFIFFDFNLRAGEMAQWAKVFAVKPGDLSFIPGATW